MSHYYLITEIKMLIITEFQFHRQPQFVQKLWGKKNNLTNRCMDLRHTGTGYSQKCDRKSVMDGYTELRNIVHIKIIQSAFLDGMGNNIR